MTKSLSNTMRVKDYPKEKPNTRVYSIIPARAVQDDSLHPTSLKVLAALCIHTNGHGICFPSLLTLGRHLSVARETVSRHITRLVKAGYVRRLEAKDYPKGVKKKGVRMTNRYQVLFNGNDLLPTKEQFMSPVAAIVDDRAVMDVALPDVAQKRTGGLGDENKSYQLLAHAFKQAIESTSGITRLSEPSYQAAKVLHNQGVTVSDVRDAAIAATKDALKNGRTPPLTLDQVAKWSGLYKK